MMMHRPTPISIHALREEGDRQPGRSLSCAMYFYPRPPRGGRPRAGHITAHFGNISIHALREEGDEQPPYSLAWVTSISIHALREEGDEAVNALLMAGEKISIHALREEGDGIKFNFSDRTGYFYPRPPRGGRLPMPG